MLSGYSMLAICEEPRARSISYSFRNRTSSDAGLRLTAVISIPRSPATASLVIFQPPACASSLQRRRALASRRFEAHCLPTPHPAIFAEGSLGTLGLPRAEPVNIKIENGSDMRESAQWRDRDSASPELHVVFTHVQPLRCLGRAD